MNHRAIYDAVLADIQTAVPNFRVLYKAESWLMAAIGVVFGVIGFIGGLFRARPLAGYRAARDMFVLRYTTTIGASCYMKGTRAENLANPDWDTLAHEGVHARDDHRKPVRFKLSYLFPQILALLALGAIAGIWWRPALWCLVALAAIAPWPAPFRVYWERRGYRMSIVCAVLERGENYVKQPAFLEWMADHFTKADYWFMGGFWPGARRRIESMIKTDIMWAIAICDGRLSMEPYTSTARIIRRAALLPLTA